jgi:hypothetical protein
MMRRKEQVIKSDRKKDRKNNNAQKAEQKEEIEKRKGNVKK